MTATSALHRDSCSRTTLIELLDGLSPAEADARVAGFIIQLEVGRAVLASQTHQASLLTAVSCAKRAAPGGVRVRLSMDGPCLLPWGHGEPLAHVIASFGGTLVESLTDDKPTIVIGETVPAIGTSSSPPGSIVVWVTWNGWAAGVVDDPSLRIAEQNEMELAGVLAAAIGVSEALQHLRGNVEAGRRSAGASLWRPDLDWGSPDAVGPRLQFLPAGLWLAGLGHLGQAYAWALGMLPYDDPSGVIVMLQDYDRVVQANESTGLVTTAADRGIHKTRVVAACLEKLGFDTRISERRFHASTSPDIAFDEPTTLLAGFDDPRPRRQLEGGGGFAHIVDAGLGSGKRHYLDLLLHTFPGETPAADSFPTRERDKTLFSDRMKDEIRRRIEAGEDPGEARCGVMLLYGTAAAAAFVGATAAAFVLGDVLRAIHGGRRFDVVDFSLRTMLLTVAESSRPKTSGLIPTVPVGKVASAPHTAIESDLDAHFEAA